MSASRHRHESTGRLSDSLIIRAAGAAAIFIDLQEEHRQDQRHLVEDFDRVIVNVQRLQNAARENGIPPPLRLCRRHRSGSTPPFHPVLPDGHSVFSDKDDPLTAICAEVAPPATSS